jgi:hypothetical protein
MAQKTRLAFELVLKLSILKDGFSLRLIHENYTPIHKFILEGRRGSGRAEITALELDVVLVRFDHVPAGP